MHPLSNNSLKIYGLIRQRCAFSSAVKKVVIDTKLNPRHKNIAEGKINPIMYDWEKETSYLQERFGTYGLASNVNMSLLWPTVEEINDLQACNLYSPYKEALEAARLEQSQKEKEAIERLRMIEKNEKKYSSEEIENKQ
uniref:Large ribosomal subunit protein mL64 n=1 Tax=Parastrongyloides trichosuri TaxID=131310 RepID=A0A0N4ZKD1_PARTI